MDLNLNCVKYVKFFEQYRPDFSPHRICIKLCAELYVLHLVINLAQLDQ